MAEVSATGRAALALALLCAVGAGAQTAEFRAPPAAAPQERGSDLSDAGGAVSAEDLASQLGIALADPETVDWPSSPTPTLDLAPAQGIAPEFDYSAIETGPSATGRLDGAVVALASTEPNPSPGAEGAGHIVLDFPADSQVYVRNLATGRSAVLDVAPESASAGAGGVLLSEAAAERLGVIGETTLIISPVRDAWRWTEDPNAAASPWERAAPSASDPVSQGAFDIGG